MRILGIDSATSSASAALIEDHRLIGEEIWRNKRGINGSGFSANTSRAEVILPLIDTLLEKSRVTLNDLSAIAVSIGPGSFTGLRVGLATAKGIGYSRGIPVIGISTLLASAARVTGFNGNICALLDARKKDVYVGLFRRDGELLTRVANDALCSINAAIELMWHSQRDGLATTLMAIGDGTEVYEEALMSAFDGLIQLTMGDEYRSVAAQVAMLAHTRMLARSVDDIGTLVPVYLRRPEAEVKKYLTY